MNQKDRAIVKGKMDRLQTMYLEAWRKQIDNDKLKSMWQTISDVSVSFDQVCARLDYYHQAALERDDQFWLTMEENTRLKEQIEQLKEANEFMSARIKELLREYEI